MWSRLKIANKGLLIWAPVWIVHVLLSDFVWLGVYIDGVLSLRGHELAPDDAALLSHLQCFQIFKTFFLWFILPQIQEASLNAKPIQQKGDFLLHIPFQGKKESGPSQMGP